MKCLILSAIEVFGICVAIDLAENGYHGTAFMVGGATVLFAYIEGRYGWSV